MCGKYKYKEDRFSCLRAHSPQRILYRARRFRTTRYRAAIDRRIDGQALAPLDPAINMVIIPHLRQNRPSTISGTIARCSLIVPRARAADIWDCAEALSKRRLQVGQGVPGGVAGTDILGGQPTVGRKLHVVHDGSLEEVHHVFVLAVLGSVTGHVEGRETGGVFGEFVRPEIGVRTTLRNPVSGI